MGVRAFVLAGLISALIVGHPSLAKAATTSAFTVKILQPKLDYPGPSITGTRALDINNIGSVTFGLSLNNDNVNFQMGLYSSGKFIPPTLDPNAPSYTQVDQINDSNTVAGVYIDAANAFHGLTYSNGVFTTFDVNVSGAVDTALFGINNQGDVAGYYEQSTPTFFIQPFAQIAGVETDVKIPGAAGGYVSAINNFDLTTGSYSTTDRFAVEATCGCHGFVRRPAGSVVTFDPAGSVSTVPHGINNRNVVVGRYYDSAKAVHGFVYFGSNGTSFTYDYPGATATSLNGINDSGIIAARYTDTSGAAHGFLGQIVKAAAN